MYEFLLIGAFLLFSAAFSGSEIGLYSLSQVKLRYRYQQGHRRARLLHWLSNPPGPSIITILIGNNIAALLLTTTTESLFHTSSWSVLITTLVLTPVVLLFGEFLPKYQFRAHANRLMYDVSYFLAACRVVFWLPVWIADTLAKGLQKLVGTGSGGIWEPHTSRTNLRNFLNAEASGHSLTPVQKQLIDRVMALERLTCSYHKVSKPLKVLQAIDAGASVAAARNGLEAPYYSRYLVTSHSDGRPIGYISASTLVTADGTANVGELAQPLPVLSRDTSLALALQRMHQSGADLALLLDEADHPTEVLFRGDCLRILVRMG